MLLPASPLELIAVLPPEPPVFDGAVVSEEPQAAKRNPNPIIVIDVRVLFMALTSTGVFARPWLRHVRDREFSTRFPSTPHPITCRLGHGCAVDKGSESPTWIARAWPSESRRPSRGQQRELI